MNECTSAQKKDIRVIGKFVEIYCASMHQHAEHTPVILPSASGTHIVCSDCASFIEYAVTKRLKCPLEVDKPSCKKCRIHCYDEYHRKKAREIMSSSGRKLMMRGRLDYIWHYFF